MYDAVLDAQLMAVLDGIKNFAVYRNCKNLKTHHKSPQEKRKKVKAQECTRRSKQRDQGIGNAN